MFSVILYMSEIAPKKVRGALVAGYQFCITIGILLANCVVYATQDRDDTGSYRIVGVGGETPYSLRLSRGFLPRQCSTSPGTFCIEQSLTPPLARGDPISLVIDPRHGSLYAS
jgi:hypothetical protein